MRCRLIILQSLVSLLLLCGCKQSQQPPAAPVLNSQQREQAAARFAELCAGCHGKDARGGVGPDLTVSQYRYGKQKAAIVTSIQSGRPGGMPAYTSHLSQAEAAALAAYLLSL